MKKYFSIFAGLTLLTLFLCLAVHQADSIANLGAAEEAYLHGKYSDAALLYEKSLDASGTNLQRARLGLLRNLLITGQYEKVEELARQYLKDSDSAQFYLFMGRSLTLRGKYGDAAKAFELAASPNSVLLNEAQMELALLYKLTGRLKESRSLFSEIYERISKEESPPLGIAAVALKNLDRYKEANILFKKATRQNPNDLETWIHWGNLLLEKYNPAEAATVFADVIKINPNHPEALLGLALCRGEGHGEEVQGILKKSLEINPNFENAHVTLADFALQSEAWDETAKEIELCFKVNPKSLKALTLKVVFHYAKDETSEMQARIREVLGINPYYGEVYESLGNFCVTQRLYKESVDFFRKALEVNPRLWTAHSALGINLLRIGQEGPAKEALEVSYENDPFNLWTVNSLRLIDSYENFESLQIDHFDLRLHKKESKVLRHYVPHLLEEAYQTLSQKYRYSPGGSIYFEMFPDHEDFAVRTLGVPGLGALGVCFGRGVVMDSPSARPRGTFNWGRTLWHEFAHVITLGITDHRVPRWFTEGLSVMEEHQARLGWGESVGLETLKAIQDKKLLPISELNSGFLRPRFPGQVQLSYFQAGQACNFIRTEFGFEAILKMLQMYKARMPIEKVLPQTLNLTVDEFDKKFNIFLESQFGKALRSVDFALLEKKDLLSDPKKLEALLLKEPDNFFANLKLASYHRDAGEIEKAIDNLKNCKSIFPGYVEPDSPYKQLSEIYKQQGRNAEAIAELQFLTTFDDNDFDSLKKLAQWLKEAQKPREAWQTLEKILYVHPFDSETHQLFGELSEELQEMPTALQEFRALLALDPPDKAAAHLNVANVLMKMGNKSEAKKEVLAALEIAPGFEQAQKLLLEAIEPGVR